MRLFLAVDVDEPTRRIVAAWRNQIVAGQGSAAKALRWVRPEQLHITLRFLGDAVDLTRLTETLATPLSVAPFSLAWSAPGWLPPGGRPRVLCVGVGEGIQSLLAASAAVAERLETIGVAPEPRPFTPHLTLARVRDGVAPSLIGQLQRIVADVPMKVDAVRVAVSHVTLYESQLSPAGPSYGVCQQIALS